MNARDVAKRYDLATSEEKEGTTKVEVYNLIHSADDSGWQVVEYKFQKTKITVNTANVTAELIVYDPEVRSNSYASMDMQFMLILEDNEWKISGTKTSMHK